YQTSVVVVGLPEGPGFAGIAVDGLDVAEAPLDLGGRIGLPVRPRGGHLAAWQRLRDAVRAAGILRVVPPAALPVPHVLQAAEKGGRAEAEASQHVVRNGLGRAGVRRRRRDKDDPVAATATATGRRH